MTTRQEITDEQQLVALMAGRRIEDVYPAIPDQRGEVVLKVEGLSHPT